ncbi:MAG: alpha/beta hydrolase, partial [Bdellovibrionaceae bacterium]|nr:alpha/beta hydrolase [Pseudobdellovibrionaceae bacterium]
LVDADADRALLRILAIDRPGIGLSSPNPNRRVVDWVDDVREVLDQLGVGDFAVLADGHGSPYAFALATSLVDQVIALAATQPARHAHEERREKGWFLRYGDWLGERFPFLHAVPLSMLQRALRDDPQEGIERILSAWPETERDHFADEFARKILLADIREAFRQGLEGPLNDAIVLEMEWGFLPQTVQCPVLIEPAPLGQKVMDFLAVSALSRKQGPLLAAHLQETASLHSQHDRGTIAPEIES